LAASQYLDTEATWSRSGGPSGLSSMGSRVLINRNQIEYVYTLGVGKSSIVLRSGQILHLPVDLDVLKSQLEAGQP
jgi:hypothetical protein